MTPNSTNARRTIENVAFRAEGNGARIRNTRAESSRNQVSILMLVHKVSISRATPVEATDGGTKAHPGPSKPDSVIENPLSLTLLGEYKPLLPPQSYDRCLTEV
jgi:hypothetical protein